MFGFGRHVNPGPSNVDRAIALTRQTTRTAKALDERLKPYLEKNDPFAALVADVYQDRQIAHITDGETH